MNDEKFCPCCGRSCDLSELHCSRGEEYVRNGVMTSKHSEKTDLKEEYYAQLSVDEKLTMMIRNLGHVTRFLSEGKGSQKRILVMLRQYEKITQSELTELIGVKPGSMSEVLGKLEMNGLIERTPSKVDRRTIDICLTEAGQIQADDLKQQRVSQYENMYSCLSNEEKVQLLQMIEKINADWRERYASDEKYTKIKHCHKDKDDKHHKYHKYHKDHKHGKHHHDKLDKE